MGVEPTPYGLQNQCSTIKLGKLPLGPEFMPSFSWKGVGVVDETFRPKWIVRNTILR